MVKEESLCHIPWFSCAETALVSCGGRQIVCSTNMVKMAEIPLSESYFPTDKTDPLRQNFDKALHEKLRGREGLTGQTFILI
jgi:hypothetical protein